MNFIIDYVKSSFPNDLTAIIITVIAIFSLWMYKELRAFYTDSEKNLAQRIDKAIELYSDLDFEIYKYRTNKGSYLDVINKINKASFVMPYELHKVCEIIKENNEELKDTFNDLNKMIKDEINRLKLKQKDGVTFKNDGDFTEYVENYVKTKIAPFGMPFIHTYFNMAFTLGIVLFTFLIINEPSIFQRTLLLTFVMDSILYVFYVLIIFSTVIMKNRFKHSKLNWLLLTLFVVLPPTFIFLDGWYRGIIVFVLMILYTIYASKKSVIRKPTLS